MSIGNLKDSGNLGNNFPWQLKMLQGLQGIYDEVKKPLTCLEDSVAVCAPLGGFNVNLHDGTGNPITSTVVGPDRGIDVNIINALPLEINLDPGNDSVGIYGYTNIADPNSFTGIKVNASGQLDIRPLTCVDKLSLCFNDGVSDVTVSSANPLPVNTTIVSPLGIQADCANAVSTALCQAQQDILTNIETAVEGTLNVNVTNTVDIRSLTCTDEVSLCANGNTVDSGNPLPVSLPAGVQITPNIQVSENDIATIINPVYSISFANIGTADALVSFDSGTTQESIPPGVTINMDAGGLGNFYASATFAWDTQSNLGSKLVITYNT